MFLTTNRISAIDTAFKGRIDLILPYYDLDEDSRKNVWKNFINRLDPGLTEVSQDDFDVLAKNEMNGREIKNSIKTAMVLAEHKKEPLKLEHLRVVLDIRKRVSTFEQLHEERNVMKQQPLRASSLAGKRKHGDD
jgi:SpoVK/Ycf46/Vps4 family AAA+-type ATPase